jgi:hypothetical protein
MLELTQTAQMAPIRSLLAAGVASLLVCSANALGNTINGACPSVGSTGAINCYDNVLLGNNNPATADPQPAGGICFVVSWTDADGPQVYQGSTDSVTDCSNDLLTATALMDTGVVGTATFCTTNLCNTVPGGSPSGAASVSTAAAVLAAAAVAALAM